MVDHLPVVPGTCSDRKGYMRCCIACRQPWKCEVNSVGDLNTYLSFGLQAFCNRLNNAEGNSPVFYFATEIEGCHVFQKAQQSSAIRWICKTTTDITLNNITFELDHREWGAKKPRRSRATWPKPDSAQFIQHKRLRFFLYESGMDLKSDRNILPEIVYACQKCNDVMDTTAKLRRTLFGNMNGNNWQPGIIPEGVLDIRREANGAYPAIGNILPEPRANNWFRDHIGCLSAWYLHSSFLYLAENITDQAQFNEKRKLAGVLSYLALLVFTHWFNMCHPEDKVRKPMFTYKGLINLYISFHQYVCTRAEFPDINLSFTAFHTLYFLEMFQCKTLFDENNNFPFQYVVQRDLEIDGNKKKLIEKISDRLIDLYLEKTRHVIRAIFQTGNVNAPNPLNRFFISRIEKEYLYAQLPECGNSPKDYNLQDFINVIGINAMLYQCLCLMEHENIPKLTKAMQQWIMYIIKNHEHKNIAMSGFVDGMLLTMEEAVLAYNYQYVLNLPDMIAKDGNMYQILIKNDSVALYHALAIYKRCSIFKAAVRLMRIHFTDASWRKNYQQIENGY